MPHSPSRMADAIIGSASELGRRAGCALGETVPPGQLDHVGDGEVLRPPGVVKRGSRGRARRARSVRARSRGVASSACTIISPSNEAISRMAASSSRPGSTGGNSSTPECSRASETEDACVIHRFLKVGHIARHRPAPEPNVDVRLALCGFAFHFERRHVDGGRDAVQRHVHERGDTAGGRGLRRAREALPLGTTGIVDVHV